jgi:hypothetical protein
VPRYLSTSPYEQTLMGLSVGVNGTAVFPTAGRPDPAPGSTVVLGEGDEIETAAEIHFPGAARLDTPTPAPTSTEETAKP